MDERKIAQLLGIADSATHSQVMEKVREIHDYALDLWGNLEDWPIPAVTYKVKGTVAGYAYSAENRIDLNLGFLLSDDESVVRNMYEETVGHEIAHLITDRLYHNPSPHGEDWKDVMRRLGLEPERCHNYGDVQPARQHKKYLYACGCINRTEPHKVGAAIHRRLQNGERSYYCKRCKQPLVYLNRVVIPRKSS